MPEGRPLLLCLTGGGTAGHVTPHFALLPGVKARGWKVFYIGSSGMEKPLVEAAGIEFVAVASGKLRRYLSVRNLVDVFKVFWGCVQAFFVLLRRRPDAVFSKGGFVAVPVAWAAWALRIPVVSHESDLTPGLANKLIAPIARKVVYTFPETGRYLKGRSEQVGSPIRRELFEGSRAAGLRVCGFDPNEDLPTILFMGGSQGAQRVNEGVREILPWLVERARVIHQTGAGKGVDFKHPRYKSFEFIRDELKDLYALADVVAGRAGANSIFEFLALKKPMLLIPLEIGSRGDQVANAEAFRKHGWALVLRETALTPASLRSALTELLENRAALSAAQATGPSADAAEKILGIIATAAGSAGCRGRSP